MRKKQDGRDLNVDIIAKMNGILAKHAPEMTVVFTNYPSAGVYFQGERIELNQQLLEEEFEELKEQGIFFQSVEGLTMATFVHELGHHMDWKKGKLQQSDDAWMEVCHACSNGQTDQIKQLYRRERFERYQAECRACMESLQLIPKNICMKTFVQYNENCLETYRVFHRYKYRLNVIQAKIADLLQHYLGNHEEFRVRFWMEHEDEPSYFEKKEKILYLNLLPFSLRYDLPRPAQFKLETIF